MLVVHELLEVIFRISVATLFEVEKAVQDYGGVFVTKDLFVIIRLFKCFTDDRNVFGDAFGALGQFFILLRGRLEQFIVWIGGDVQQVLWDFYKKQCGEEPRQQHKAFGPQLLDAKWDDYCSTEAQQ